MHILKLNGNLDFRYIGPTRKLLLQHLADSDDLIVDMSNVHRIDSAGLAGLVEVTHAARVSGLPFRLHAVRDGVRKVIEFARLDRVFLDVEFTGTVAPEGHAA